MCEEFEWIEPTPQETQPIAVEMCEEFEWVS